jgi:O-antigen/teichoic acid export membrane protein
MKAALLSWTRSRFERLDMLHSASLWLLAGTGLTAVFGFVYWIMATRLAPAGPIGQASAAMASIAVLQSLADFGLAVSLLHYTASHKHDPAKLSSTVMAASITACGAATVGFLVLIPWLSPGLVVVRQSVWLALTFALTAVSNAALGVQDAVVLANGRPQYLFWRHAGISLFKLLLLYPLLEYMADDFQALFLASALPVIAAAVWANASVLPRLTPGFHLVKLFSFPLLTGLVRYGISNHAGNLLWGLPALLLPVICVNRVSAEGTAYFTVSWTLLNLVLLAPRAVAPALLAEASRQRSARLAKGRRAFGLMLRLSVLPMVALWFGGSLLTARLFGLEYTNTLLLHILLLSALPYIFNSTYTSLLRASEALAELILVCAVSGIGTVVIAIALAPGWGETGIATGWLVGQVLAAMVALPRLWRFARSALGASLRSTLSESEP